MTTIIDERLSSDITMLEVTVMELSMITLVYKV